MCHDNVEMIYKQNSAEEREGKMKGRVSLSSVSFIRTKRQQKSLQLTHQVVEYKRFYLTRINTKTMGID